MEENSRGSFSRASVIIAIIALAIEFVDLFVLNLYLTPVPYVFLLITVHALILLGIFIFVVYTYKQGNDLRYPFLLLLAAFGAGPFGLAGFLLMVLLVPIFSYFAPPVYLFLQDLFPEQHLSPFIKIFQRIRSGWEDYSHITEVSSFQDLFNHGTLVQKQAVLDAIVKDYHPAYAKILKKALNDSYNSVRIQAAAIMAKIDYEFESELKKLIANEIENPDDMQLVLNLAQHYDTYVVSGVLDEVRAKEIGNEGVHFYRQYLSAHPDNRNIWFAIGRILFHIKEYNDYIEWCNEYTKKFGTLPTIYHTWHLEALYNSHRLAELADLVRG